MDWNFNYRQNNVIYCDKETDIFFRKYLAKIHDNIGGKILVNSVWIWESWVGLAEADRSQGWIGGRWLGRRGPKYRNLNFAAFHLDFWHSRALDHRLRQGLWCPHLAGMTLTLWTESWGLSWDVYCIPDTYLSLSIHICRPIVNIWLTSTTKRRGADK